MVAGHRQNEISGTIHPFNFTLLKGLLHFKSWRYFQHKGAILRCSLPKFKIKSLSLTQHSGHQKFLSWNGKGSFFYSRLMHDHIHPFTASHYCKLRLTGQTLNFSKFLSKQLHRQVNAPNCKTLICKSWIMLTWELLSDICDPTIHAPVTLSMQQQTLSCHHSNAGESRH